ncbi:MAG: hypothetical protein IPM70_16890 [Proteobacteria bacterium]|jgi:hypothetical protein|nr:hypothetical protein [Pseudomonadota bacterium]MBK9253432.1 hypothetical protein [Pseudomonadota bacterium]
MKTFNNRAALAIAAAAGSLALMLPAGAHHSTAMFDFAKTVEIKGTIKEFQWTNPHTWTKVDVEGGGAATVEYGLEGMSPNYLTRNGWSKRTLKTGDKVVLQVHPLKDGRPGGFMVSVKLADGTVMYNLPRREDPAAAAAAAAGR